MGDKPRELSESIAERFAVAREWLQRVMPRVALAAVALYILRLLIRDTWLYRETPLGLVATLTVLAVCATVAYYTLKLAVRVKRKLLWRVRRRLIITYLFIGLTPIVLLLILGTLAATGGSTQTMVRVVTVQINDSQRRTLEGARALAEGLASLPADAFPNVRAVSGAMFAGDDDDRFEFGLDLLVRGLAALVPDPPSR